MFGKYSTPPLLSSCFTDSDRDRRPPTLVALPPFPSPPAPPDTQCFYHGHFTCPILSPFPVSLLSHLVILTLLQLKCLALLLHSLPVCPRLCLTFSFKDPLDPHRQWVSDPWSADDTGESLCFAFIWLSPQNPTVSDICAQAGAEDFRLSTLYQQHSPMFGHLQKGRRFYHIFSKIRNVNV